MDSQDFNIVDLQRDASENYARVRHELEKPAKTYWERHAQTYAERYLAVKMQDRIDQGEFGKCSVCDSVHQHMAHFVVVGDEENTDAYVCSHCLAKMVDALDGPDWHREK